VFGQGLWVNHTQSPETLVGTTKATFTKTVSTIGATLNDTEKLAFEFGKGVPAIFHNRPYSITAFFNCRIRKANYIKRWHINLLSGQ
jgi:hypothetical protein